MKVLISLLFLTFISIPSYSADYSTQLKQIAIQQNNLRKEIFLLQKKNARDEKFNRLNNDNKRDRIISNRNEKITEMRARLKELDYEAAHIKKLRTLD